MSVRAATIAARGTAPDLTGPAVALAIGLAGLALAALGWLLDPRSFFAGYLAAYLFWSGIALGCLGTALLQQVTGGLWGLTLRRIAEAGARTLPVVAVMFVPLLLGLPHAVSVDTAGGRRRQRDAPAEDAVSQRAVLRRARSAVLRVLDRACHVCWTACLSRRTALPARRDGPALRRLGIGGLIVLGLTVAFAMIDWAMSLEPDWYSTIYPSMVATGSLLAAFAFMILVVLWLAPRSDLASLVTPRRAQRPGQHAARVPDALGVPVVSRSTC